MFDIEQMRLLVLLAQRNGSQSDIYWHTNTWENFLGPGPMIQKYTCLICNKDIVNEQYHPYMQYIWITTIEEHGIQHLSNFGAFL